MAMREGGVQGGVGVVEGVGHGFDAGVEVGGAVGERGVRLGYEFLMGVLRG